MATKAETRKTGRPIIEYDVKDLIEADWNTSTNGTKEEVEQLARSIKFDNSAGILAVRTNEAGQVEVMDGNHRLRAIKLLGWAKVQAEYFGDLDKANAVLVAERRNIKWFKKESARVDAALKGIVVPEISVDTMRGIFPETDEIDKILKRLEVPDGPKGHEENYDYESAVDDVKTSRMKAGDTYECGRHVIYCGDSVNSIGELFVEGTKADMGFADPPYNLGYEYKSYDDKRKRADYENFCLSWFQELKKYSERTFITPGIQNIPMWAKIQEFDWLLSWIKMNSQSGGKMRGFSKWEPIVFYGKMKNIMGIDVIEVNTDRIKGLRDDHTCPKPVKLMETLIEGATDKGDTVLDCFGGSGTTLIACETAGRKARIIEKDPIYCELMIRRFESLTGGDDGNRTE